MRFSSNSHEILLSLIEKQTDGVEEMMVDQVQGEKVGGCGRSHYQSFHGVLSHPIIVNWCQGLQMSRALKVLKVT